MTDMKFPARLHVVLARGESTGVIIRRGPSKYVATFLWNRTTDAISLGQWMKGRIYERRCDISPDGRHLLYFAMNGRWHSKTGGSWTAVSRAPYLRALDLYAKGDCWEGGGLFLSDEEYWLNDRHYSDSCCLRRESSLSRKERFSPRYEFGAECTNVYYNRLIRDGWKMVGPAPNSQPHTCVLFEKRLNKTWMLRKIAHEQIGSPPGKGCYWDEHELQNERTDTVTKHPAWEWADGDDGCVLWAEHGRLMRARLVNDRIESSTMVHDLYGYEFTPVEAPY